MGEIIPVNIPELKETITDCRITRLLLINLSNIASYFFNETKISKDVQNTHVFFFIHGYSCIISDNSISNIFLMQAEYCANILLVFS